MYLRPKGASPVSFSDNFGQISILKLSIAVAVS